MERFKLDLDQLPRNKKEALQFFLDNLTSDTTDKNNLVCGLIFLGFKSLKGKSLKNLTVNIPVSQSANFKMRISISDVTICSQLEAFTSPKAKRNCVLALIYMGISCFEDYSAFIQGRNDRDAKKGFSVESIEENIYLSGLTTFFESYNSDYLFEYLPPLKRNQIPSDSSLSIATASVKENQEEFQLQKFETLKLVQENKVALDSNLVVSDNQNPDEDKLAKYVPKVAPASVKNEDSIDSDVNKNLHKPLVAERPKREIRVDIG